VIHVFRISPEYSKLLIANVKMEHTIKNQKFIVDCVYLIVKYVPMRIQHALYVILVFILMQEIARLARNNVLHVELDLLIVLHVFQMLPEFSKILIVNVKMELFIKCVYLISDCKVYTDENTTCSMCNDGFYVNAGNCWAC